MSRRPGRRSRAVLALLALVAAVAASVAGAPGAGAQSPGGDRTSAAPPAADAPRRVLVVTLPRVTWDRLDAVDAPNLEGFLDGAAVASMSTRTVGPRTDPSGAYLTIGAGNRADSLDPLTAGEAAGLDEITASGPAAAVYQRRTGVTPTGEVVVLSVAEQVQRNEDLLYGAEPGAFGSALADAGHEIGVVGNADESLDDALHREVALAAMDRDGQVPAGRVSSSLLIADDAAPFGVRTDAAAVLTSVELAWQSADVLVVEMSDLERAEAARAQSTSEQGDVQFDRALVDADRMFGALLGTVDLERDLVMVLGPTAPLDAEQLTVFGMRGPGVERGWARSPTTRRPGYMTLTDVAPTILERFGIDRPSAMNDTPADSVASDESLAQRAAAMVRSNERAVFRDEVTGPVTVAFIVLLVVLLLAVAWCLSRRNRWAPWVRWCCLVVLACPSAIYLAGLLPYDPFTTVTYALAILAAAGALGAVAVLFRGVDDLLPPMLLALLSVVVLAVDITTGGSLQLNTVFGYSPIVAGRFAGFGNQAFSILTISALIVVTATWEMWAARRPGATGARVAAAVVFFAAVVVLDGAPQFGADVGGVLASVPAFAVCTLLLAGRRIRLRLAALIGVATVGVLTVFALIDLSRPVESRTHLGRFAQKVADGDVAVILQRKLEANVSILTSTIWTVVIPVALLFIAYLTWRPNRMLRRINARHPGFRPFGVSALVLGLLAWAVNDSGVSIPALMLTVALPYTAYLVLQALGAPEPAPGLGGPDGRADHDPGDGPEPDPGDPDGPERAEERRGAGALA